MKSKTILIATACAALFGLASCERKTPAEEAVDNVGDAIEDAADEIGDAARDAD